MVVPIFSTDVLQKLISHDPLAVDNMLLEWVMCLLCYSDPSSVTMAVFPFAFGTRSFSESNEVIIQSLFSDHI